MKLTTAESILLPLQRLQRDHDEVAHRDILSFDLYKKLKHMVLHFYKYSGNIQVALVDGDLSKLRKALVDTFIICMASANAMNLSLGERIHCDEMLGSIDALAEALSKEISNEDLFSVSLHSMLVFGGQMAKAIESSDHMEQGNPRAAMEELVPQLATAVLGVLGVLGKSGGSLESEIRMRLQKVEQKSIFLRSLNCE